MVAFVARQGSALQIMILIIIGMKQVFSLLRRGRKDKPLLVVGMGHIIAMNPGRMQPVKHGVHCILRGPECFGHLLPSPEL